jgi:hypothetical protein
MVGGLEIRLLPLVEPSDLGHRIPPRGASMLTWA